MYISLYISTGGHDLPPCHTYIYIDKNTDQSLILLTTINCHLNAHKHVSAKPVPNVMRGCLISFLMGYDRNDRNDKGNGKSYMRKIGRGLQISCHSCHLCHWGC